MPPEQYAYRPGRSALQAIQQVQALLDTGHTEVIDADLSGYFDSIPHHQLLRAVARRVSDRHLLGLVKSGSMSGEWKRGTVGYSGTGNRKVGNTQGLAYATASLLDST